MKNQYKILWLLVALRYAFILPLAASDGKHMPVTPNASPEAVALLNLFYSTSGKYIFTGQHNYPNTRDRNTVFAANYIGKTPAIFSTDWGFAKDGDTDSYLARQKIVDEAIRQHKLGSIITICWHAVPPTANEPVTFQPLPGASPDSLASVQGHLTDKQFMDVLTPGTALYKHWCAQVDSIAVYLKKLQAAHVPVLWRPYHEMNGDWFWWGGRVGKYSTVMLYKQIFDRLVNYHKLNNLVWIWSVDRPSTPQRQFADFYPGNDYLDILGLDVYGSDFNQSYYDGLLALSHGKPLVLAEVGNPPTLDILEKQPKWGYYVTWAGMVRNTLKMQYEVLVVNPFVLSREDSAYMKIVSPYRSACGLPRLEREVKYATDFSGYWEFVESKSYLDNAGTAGIPAKLIISVQDNELTVQKTYVSEFSDDRLSNQSIPLDGNEYLSEMNNLPMATTASLSARGDTIFLNSKVKYTRGNQTSEMVSKEFWVLSPDGKILTISQDSDTIRGKRRLMLIYKKF
jgi:mannan endo-1,4-beta-mannosidase